jgi:hypothetical protein
VGCSGALPLPVLVPPVRTARTGKPVRVFSAESVYGPHRFTSRDLQNVVNNFNHYQSGRSAGWPHPQALAIPQFDPAVLEIGHDPDQLVAKAILSRTDLPSIGEPTRLWMQGPDLFAELDGIPEELAAMIQAGQFKHVSATIYPNYRTPDGKYHGPTLRGISILGYTQPVLKGLGKISPLVFSERTPGGRPVQQYVAAFSESPFMDETQALEVLKKCFPDADLSTIPPAFAIMLASWIAEKSPAIAPSTDPTPTDSGVPPQLAQQFSERIGTLIDQRLQRAIAPMVTQMGTFTATMGNQLKEQEKQQVLAFSETNREKLYPYELDPKNESYIVSRLLNIPPQFRAMEMKAIEARPKVLSFSEQTSGMPDPVMSDNPAANGHGRIVGADGGTMTAERQKVLVSYSKIGAGQRAAVKN